MGLHRRDSRSFKKTLCVLGTKRRGKQQQWKGFDHMLQEGYRRRSLYIRGGVSLSVRLLGARPIRMEEDVTLGEVNATGDVRPLIHSLITAVAPVRYWH